MPWDPTHPADNSAVVSPPLRGNFAALNTAVMSPLATLAPNQVLKVGAADELAGVPASTDGFILTLVGGVPLWQAAPTSGFSNPMTSVGDLIRGGTSGAATRLAVGTNGHWLTLTAGVPAWSALPVDPGFANPMTTQADLIQGGASGVPTRLAKGVTTGHVLTVTGATSIGWQVLPVDPGFANPMTTLGDVITGGASGAPGRLGIGTTGHVLTVVSGAPAWQAPAAASATRYVRLPIEGATLPDGTTGNVPPELLRDVSTGTLTNAPSPTRTYAAFDPAVDEVVTWGFILPGNWTAGGTVRLKWKARTATSGNVMWKAGVAIDVDGTTNDGTVAFAAVTLSAASAAPGTAGIVASTTVALTMTNAAANRFVTLFVGRDADHASDTMAGDAVLMGVAFEYTA